MHAAHRRNILVCLTYLQGTIKTPVSLRQVLLLAFFAFQDLNSKELRETMASPLAARPLARTRAAQAYRQMRLKLSRVACTTQT